MGEDWELLMSFFPKDCVRISRKQQPIRGRNHAAEARVLHDHWPSSREIAGRCVYFVRAIKREKWACRTNAGQILCGELSYGETFCNEAAGAGGIKIRIYSSPIRGISSFQIAFYKHGIRDREGTVTIEAARKRARSLLRNCRAGKRMAASPLPQLKQP